MSTRVSFNLSVNKELKRLMKQQCAGEEKDVSEVTEKLYREYLEQRGVRIEEPPPKTTDSESGRRYPRKQVRYSNRKNSLAMITTDRNGRVTAINRAFTKMCGYSFKELRAARSPGALLQGPATEKDVVRDFRKAIKAIRPFTCTLTNYDKSKTLYHVHIQMRPIFEGQSHIGFEAVERRLD